MWCARSCMLDDANAGSGYRPHRILDKLSSLDTAGGLLFKEPYWFRRKPRGDLWLSKGGSHGDTFSKEADDKGNQIVQLKRVYG